MENITNVCAEIYSKIASFALSIINTAMSITSFSGIFIGLGAFLIIGLLHPVVIKGEYHFGTKLWPWFLVGGIVFITLSVFVENIVFSSLSGVLGFSLFWSIHELFEQKRRVEKGWFPKNTKKVNGTK